MSLAAELGCRVEDIWDHPDNRELKEQRRHPGLLAEGDVVVLPDAEQPRTSVQARGTHQLRGEAQLTKLSLRLVAPPLQEAQVSSLDIRTEGGTKIYEEPDAAAPGEERPMAGVRYRIEIGGRVIEGETDGDGKLQVTVPAIAKEGKLIVEPGTQHELTSRLHVGRLGPADERLGVLRRFQNLGIVVEHDTEDPEKAFAVAVSVFQRKYGLSVTGVFDDRTRQALLDKHGI